MQTIQQITDQIEFPAAPVGKPTAAQWRAVRREREAWRAAAHAGHGVTASRMDAARAALRRVARAGRLSARVCEMENDRAYFTADGSEGLALRDFRRRYENSARLAAESLAPFGLRMEWPGIYPVVENAEGTPAIRIEIEF